MIKEVVCPICKMKNEVKVDNRKVLDNLLEKNNYVVLNSVDSNKYNCEINTHCLNCRHDFKVIEEIELI